MRAGFRQRLEKLEAKIGVCPVVHIILNGDIAQMKGCKCEPTRGEPMFINLDTKPARI